MYFCSFSYDLKPLPWGTNVPKMEFWESSLVLQQKHTQKVVFFFNLMQAVHRKDPVYTLPYLSIILEHSDPKKHLRIPSPPYFLSKLTYPHYQKDAEHTTLENWHSILHLFPEFWAMFLRLENPFLSFSHTHTQTFLLNLTADRFYLD